MEYNYDSYYLEENYFGASYKQLSDFFHTFEPKGSVLDLGCGQGRDTIALAKLGYQVTGVDISSVGVNQMTKLAKELNLNVIGLVDDIYQFNTIRNYDIVLLDSMLHFYKKDIIKETALLNSILDQMSIGSIFCNLLLKSKKTESNFKKVIQDSRHQFEVIYEDYADYPEASCQYHMYVVKKV